MTAAGQVLIPTRPGAARLLVLALALVAHGSLWADEVDDSLAGTAQAVAASRVRLSMATKNATAQQKNKQ